MIENEICILSSVVSYLKCLNPGTNERCWLLLLIVFTAFLYLSNVFFLWIAFWKLNKEPKYLEIIKLKIGIEKDREAFDAKTFYGYLMRNKVALDKDYHFFSLTSLFDLFFGRWHFFNNINKINKKLFIRTFVAIFNFASFYILIGILSLKKGETLNWIELKYFIGAFPVIYFSLHTIFFRKWKHCADIMNEYVTLDYTVLPVKNYELNRILAKKDLENRNKNYADTVRRQEDMLLLKLLHLDLWAHKTFYRYFNHFMYDKLKNKYGKNQEELIKQLIRLCKGEYSIQEVENLARGI